MNEAMTQQSIRDRIMSRAATAPDAAKRDVGVAPRPGQRMVLLSLLGAAVLVAAVLGATQIPAVRGFLGRPAMPGATAADPQLPETPFLAHAREAGLKACGTVFPVLGQLLSGSAQYSIQSHWNTAEPDKHAVHSVLGLNITSPDYSGPAAGIVYAAPTGTGCEGALVRVVPYQKSCDAVVAALPQDSSLATNLGAVRVYDLANGGGQVMLLPSEATCVAISVAQAAGS